MTLRKGKEVDNKVEMSVTKVLAYMAINIDFDDNKPHVFIKQRFMNCDFIITK